MFAREVLLHYTKRPFRACIRFDNYHVPIKFRVAIVWKRKSVKQTDRRVDSNGYRKKGHLEHKTNIDTLLGISRRVSNLKEMFGHTPFEHQQKFTGYKTVGSY